MADESTNKIRVIVCKADERAEVVEIEDKWGGKVSENNKM